VYKADGCVFFAQTTGILPPIIPIHGRIRAKKSLLINPKEFRALNIET
jgi:hypothetical protein